MSGREVVEAEVVGNGHGDVLSQGHAVQQVRSPYSTAVAVQKPRVLATVQRALAAEARLAGEDFYYGWAAGKDRIEGPSVELALAAARCWGNCAVDTLPVQEMADAWVFTAAFVDLETGFTLSRQFRQSKKWKVAGKMDEERKEDVRFQIGQSKAIRNVLLNALPKGLVKMALEEAKRGVRQHIEQLVGQKGIAGAVDAALRALARSGVREEAVLARCGVAERKALTVDHLVLLKGDLTAIEGGQERPEVLFPPPEEPTPEPPRRKPALKKQLALLNELAKQAGLTPPEKEALCRGEGLDSFEAADQDQAGRMIDALRLRLEADGPADHAETQAEAESIRQVEAGV
jgi:hypothetical protein